MDPDQAAWIDLEERVCAAAPYDASVVLGSHSQFVALVAGFGLAGFILLLDRSHDPFRGERRRGHSNGSLLLALAAIVGVVAGYMFSSTTGDHCLNAQIEFPFPSTLLALTAILLVAGIGVAAASQPQLGDAATALRSILTIATVLVVARMGVDYSYVDRVAQGYERFLSGAVQIVSESPENRLNVGSVTTLDSTLGAYAAERWPNDEDRWPGLLAQELFYPPRDSSSTAPLTAVAVVGAVGGMGIRLRMRNVKAHGFRLARHVGAVQEERKALQQEKFWRGGLSFMAVLSTTVTVAIFSLLPYDRLMHPGRWTWLVLFALLTATSAFAIQPPLLGNQQSLVGICLKLIRAIAFRPHR